MSNALQKTGRILKESFLTLRRNDPLILASSTAFFATFSLAPILLILVNLLTLVFRNGSVAQKLFQRIESTFGAETAEQIETIVANFRALGSHWYITIGGLIFLLFVATTLLKVVKQSINHIWRIRRKRFHKLKYNLMERSISVFMILLMTLLFLGSLLLDATVSFLQGHLENLIPSIDAYVIRVINILFSLLVVSLWFTLLYKILPDARVAWNVAIPGGILTGVLFSIGKWILGQLLQYSNIVTIFGASAAFVLVLLFIFYSAFILYFGASFTFAYSKAIDNPIKPGKYSNRFEVQIFDSNDGKS